MDRSAVDAFLETARRFAAREIAPMLEVEDRDGDLSKIPALLQMAEQAGILAGADPDSPGHEFGVWGKAADADGPLASVLVLAELARGCAGVASAVHFAGLGARELDNAGSKAGRAAVALFEPEWRLTWTGVDDPHMPGVSICTSIVKEKNGDSVLQGRKAFVYAPPGTEGFVVYAAGSDQWERCYVSADAKGLAIEDAGQRTGLAVCACSHLKIDDVPSSMFTGLPAVNPSSFLIRLWLGISAIALGNAQAALVSARQYARERYQGGDEIHRHAAVRLLVGDAGSRVSAARAHLLSAVETADPGSTSAPEGGKGRGNAAVREALISAAAAKLRIGTDCVQAVTDCLQVLGGYGYMEDYRMEKRLRDALTLQSMCVRPDDLRLLLAESGEEEPQTVERGRR